MPSTLKVIREEQVELLLKLELLDPRADEFTAYRVWGKLLRDPVIRKRALDLPRDAEFPAMISEDAPYLVVGEMTKIELAALRARIFAACAGRNLKGA